MKELEKCEKLNQNQEIVLLDSHLSMAGYKSDIEIIASEKEEFCYIYLRVLKDNFTFKTLLEDIYYYGKFYNLISSNEDEMFYYLNFYTYGVYWEEQ